MSIRALNIAIHVCEIIIVVSFCIAITCGIIVIVT